MDKYENRAMELESGIAAFETKNFAHAIKLLSPIAEEGNSEAMYRMAIMLQNGLGCIADCLLYTSPSPRDGTKSRMPSCA